ncbi:Putative ribosome biogenesis GTPase RsgA [Chlamydiales bacterium SCGC AG-110-P3]|nr:Putative ribosome biogenesis GTPase RsgA [Chlamydiales bacterium SCGC AG-110-P3]
MGKAGGGNNRDDVEAYYENHFAAEEKRESRSDRKRASAKDRSKYKITNQRQKAKGGEVLHPNIKVDRDTLVRGRVLSILSEGILVDSELGRRTCFLRGILKKERTQAKNLVTVGDFVLFEPLDDKEGYIAHVEERKSVLGRADNLSRRQQHMIAANIDQVLITVSVVEPPLKPGLVDRYIIASRKGRMDPVIVVNKVDLLDDPANVEQKALFEDFVEAYTSTGVRVITSSVESDEGLAPLKAVMRDRASVFSGQSGVGKSSLINKLTGLDLEIGDTVAKTRKGSHTTTCAQLIPLEWGGWCIDTPGIKSFGVWDLNKAEIEQYFTDIAEVGTQCHFVDCSHTHEMDCAVKEAVNDGTLSVLRYESYIALLLTIDQQHRRR